jgi:hypothetical protein
LNGLFYLPRSEIDCFTKNNKCQAGSWMGSVVVVL